MTSPTDHSFTHYSVGLYCQEVIDMYQLAFLEVFDTDHSIENYLLILF